MSIKCPITGAVYFTPRSINTVAAQSLFTGVPDSVKTIARELLSNGWRFYCVDQNRGTCYSGHRVITIPTWATHRSIDYKIWYICHEIAHALVSAAHGHDSVFMAKLIEICPPDCIHHELGYKPRNASAAGIQKPADKIIEELGF